jgi:hypothetical protein
MVIHPFSNTDVDTIYSIVALPNSYEDTIHYSAGLICYWVATIRSRFVLINAEVSALYAWFFRLYLPNKGLNSPVKKIDNTRIYINTNNAYD